MARLALLGMVVLAAGCGLPAPQVGKAVSGTSGVARAEFQVRARSTDLVKVTVLFPADASGHPLRTTARRGLVFVPGGFVPPARYEWLGAALAEQGMVVAIPAQAGDLAFFSEENGSFARDLFVSPPSDSLLENFVDAKRIAVAGHSLGGVVAVKDALAGGSSDGFDALVLMAAYPDSADVPRLSGLGMPSLSLAGQNDCDAALADVKKGWDELPSHTTLAVLEGMTHYQFTNSDAEDVKAKCHEGVALDVAHARVTAAVTKFLGAVDDGSISLGEDFLGSVEGIVEESQR